MKRISMLVFLVVIIALLNGLAFADFDSNSANITNQFFPGQEGHWGKTIGYGNLAGETETWGFVDTEVVDSVNCLKLRDISNNSVILWLAQDTDGIVWLLKVVGNNTYTLGSGISYPFMPAEPKVGDRVSHIFPECADTYGEVTEIGVDVDLSTGLGPYENCVEITCYNDYEVEELEYYCPEVGCVKTVYPHDSPPETGKELSEYGYELLTLLTPNGGEIIPSGSGYTIEWDAPFIADNFKLRLSTDNGKAWETIGKGITDTSYEWDVPTPTKNKTNCLIKVVGYDTEGAKVCADKSDSPFIIAVLTVTSPNGGEIVPSGDTYDIEWETNGTESEVDSVELFYSRDGGTTWKLIDEALIGNPGTYEWTVPAQKKNLKNCLVKVKALDVSGNKVAIDKSDAPFTIAVLEVTSPNGGETLTSGATHTITWTTNETKAEVAKVKLLYTKNGGDTWIKIDTLTGGDPGTYDWLVPSVNKAKTECRVKVELKDAEGNIVGKATSDNYFTIEPLI